MIYALAAEAFDENEPGFVQGLQMLHDSKAGKLEVLAELVCRHRFMAQQIENSSSRGVVQCCPQEIIDMIVDWCARPLWYGCWNHM